MRRSVIIHSYVLSRPRARSIVRAHIGYITHRPERNLGVGLPTRTFFNGSESGISPDTVKDSVSEQPDRGVLIHKLIISPGASFVDVQAYTRQIMCELEWRRHQRLEWYGVVHQDTAHPHAHVVIMGLDRNNRPVRLDRTDHTEMRATGDRYLEREHFLDFFYEEAQQRDEIINSEREQQPARKGLFGFATTFAGNLHKNLRWLFGETQKQPAPKESRRKQIQRHEEQAVGVFKRQYREKPFPHAHIIWNRKDHEGNNERLVVGPNSDVRLMHELLDAAAAGTRDLIPAQVTMLKSWIHDHKLHERHLWYLSYQIQAIDIAYGADATAIYSAATSPKALRALLKKNRVGEIVLSEAEERAVRIWLRQKPDAKDSSDRRLANDSSQPISRPDPEDKPKPDDKPRGR